jgi:predicted ATPase
MNIHYFVGPNGSGKTRALERVASENNAYFIQKLRISMNVSSLNDNDDPNNFMHQMRSYPEQVAFRLLRENLGLQLKVFAKLSRKLGRDFSVEIVERQPQFHIKSALSPDSYQGITVTTYDLNAESSGLREILVLLTLIHSNLSNSFCIDEPELSLHPEAQRFLKEEMELLCGAGRHFWVATHSPIIFSPTTIEELQRAVFYSDPRNPQGFKPDFVDLSDGQQGHLERSLLRLNSAQWALAHSKGVLFCEGYRDRAIIAKVCDRLGVRLSEKDICVLDVGGKDEFSTLWLLCHAIQKKAYFVGDLDCLIECKVLDKFKTDPAIRKELSGIATDIDTYISQSIRQPLGDLIKAIDEADKTDWHGTITGLVHKNKISNDANTKSQLLEFLLRDSNALKNLLSNQTSKIDMIYGAVKRARTILEKAGFFIIPTGTMETMYSGCDSSPQNEAQKCQLFNNEWSSLREESPELIRERYLALLEFIENIADDQFDSKAFVKTRIRRTLAELQTVIITEHPIDISALFQLERFKSLRVEDLIIIDTFGWNGDRFCCEGKSIAGFQPAFSFRLDSGIGLTDDQTLVFPESEL